MNNTVQNLVRFLFSERRHNVFAIVDGASTPDLLQKLDEFRPIHECLYRGEMKPDMATVAPYLVYLLPDSPFTHWLINDGWGKHWSVYIRSVTNIATMRRHLRQFLIVHSEEGKPMLFRYYDPRVLRLFLPTCNTEELTNFFGPIQAFVLEDTEEDTLIRFRRVKGVLKQEKRRFTTEEEERIAREKALVERRRRELLESERPMTEEELNQSMVNFWTTIPRFKDEDDEEGQ